MAFWNWKGIASLEYVRFVAGYGVHALLCHLRGFCGCVDGPDEDF
jgi:hypothetical protein